MTDWCLVETLREVCYGSSSNVVRWRNVPKIVILNVPDEIELTDSGLLHFLENVKPHGPRSSLYSDIAGGGLSESPPKYVLVKLGGGMPDQEMKNHITENHVFEWVVFDWLGDNLTHEYGDSWKDWYDPKVRYEYEFYSRYDVTPHKGWEFWHRYVNDEEARKKPVPGAMQ